MEIDYWQLPETAQVIAEVIGVEKTLKLAAQPHVAAHRGLYIPTTKRLKASHWLVQTLGEESAKQLSEEFPGFQMPLARCAGARKIERNERIIQLRQEGKPYLDIARELGMTVSAVKMVYSRWVKETH